MSVFLENNRVFKYDETDYDHTHFKLGDKFFYQSVQPYHKEPEIFALEVIDRDNLETIGCINCPLYYVICGKTPCSIKTIDASDYGIDIVKLIKE